MDEKQITQLEQEAQYLINELSGAKQHSMTRDRVRELMNKGFLFLHSILRALDETKFRN